MAADYKLHQHLKMSPNAQIKNIVPESLSDVPPESEWKLGRIWFNTTIGRFQNVVSVIDEATNLPKEPLELEVKVLGEDDKYTAKINYSFKKMMAKEHTLSKTEWYDEKDGIVLHQHAKEIWIDEIPTNPADADTRLVKTYNKIKAVKDATIPGSKVFYIRNEGTNERLRGFIPNSYGSGYNVKIYINDTYIPFSHSSKPMFDYANGVLTFETTPPAGEVTVDVYQYIGRTFAQYLDDEYNSVARGVLGVETPQLEYVIQHNMASYDIDVIIYVFDEVDGQNYWKKDVIPLIMLDENRVKLQLTEEHPIRFIIKSYVTPEWI